ncbi:uncharacterized protein BDZ99DRAFT_521231 [Mytilinidion resinicola]|uniref:F-box domain-containing protein n=1 Tax=Mytilinidion resinicola TaxID=574789 RepID=A0A6A6YJM8_9PEZI|nr:uncharacterized protein BDZ99DRAFT_521231 [Mytilinidion resinicola]KAF2808733.1 hypothetical protein BDZ99DRAFT_521231 [Mytilinidion resinicola]
MSTFSGLFIPVEIVYSILDLLPSQSDLACLCRVSKEFHSVVSPRLYQNPAVRYTKYTNARNAPVWTFLRTVIRRSELGARVKKAHFDNFDCDWDESRKGKETPDIDGNDLELIRNLIIWAKLPNPQEWIQAVKDGDPDALVAMALCRLSKIEILEVSFLRSRSKQRTFIGRMFEALQAIRSSTACFPHLLRIREISNLPEYFTPLQDGFWLFGVPDLQKIETKVREVSEWYTLHVEQTLVNPDPDYVLSPFRWPQSNMEVPTITTLILRQSHLSVPGMRQLLAALPNLQELEYDFWGVGNLNYEAPDELKYPCWLIFGCLPDHELNFGDGFEPLQDHLQVLRMSATVNGGEYVYGDPPYAVGSSVPALNHFKALKTLAIPLAILLGWNKSTNDKLSRILPPNLEDLEITDTFCGSVSYQWEPHQVLPRICDYLMSGAAKNLKRLILGRHLNSYGAWENDVFDPVQQLCEELGISFIYDLGCHCDEPSNCKSDSPMVEDILKHMASRSTGTTETPSESITPGQCDRIGAQMDQKHSKSRNFEKKQKDMSIRDLARKSTISDGLLGRSQS